MTAINICEFWRSPDFSKQPFIKSWYLALLSQTIFKNRMQLPGDIVFMSSPEGKTRSTQQCKSATDGVMNDQQNRIINRWVW